MALATSRHSGGCGRNLTENGGYSEKIPLPGDPKCVETRCAAARKPAGAWQDICRLILLTIPNSSMLIFDPQLHNILSIRSATLHGSDAAYLATPPACYTEFCSGGTEAINRTAIRRPNSGDICRD